MLFFLAGAGGALWATDDWRLLREHFGQCLLWLLVLAAICVPWPLAMHLIWADRFTDILGKEITARKFGKSTGMAPLSALGGALGLIAPWTLAVILAAWQHVRKPRAERPAVISGLIAWIVIAVIPFFFMQAFERYMLAVLPAEAVLASVWLQREGRAQQIALVVAVVIVVVAACGFAAFAFWFQLAFWLPLVAFALTGWLVLAGKPLPPRRNRFVLGAGRRSVADRGIGRDLSHARPFQSFAGGPADRRPAGRAHFQLPATRPALDAAGLQRSGLPG